MLKSNCGINSEGTFYCKESDFDTDAHEFICGDNLMTYDESNLEINFYYTCIENNNHERLWYKYNIQR